MLEQEKLMHALRHLYLFIQLESDVIKRKTLKQEIIDILQKLDIESLSDNDKKEVLEISSKLSIELNSKEK